jgi:hypothetical protein
MGGRKSYNPKNKGKKSYQPMLTFIAETREYVCGELRNGDRPSGKQIGDHIRNVHAALPPGVKQVYGRADSGFYCWDAVEAYEEFNDRFVLSARKTARLVERLRQAEWKPSPKTDGDAEYEFFYQPVGWKKACRFVALRYEKTREELEAEEATEQYQLFETGQYKYRVFVTNFSDPIYFVVWFYNRRGGAENLIKEANNDAGLTAHPSGRFDVNSNHFQLAMLAYNLNCWLTLFSREPQTDATALQHTTLATSRLRFLFVAAKIWRYAGRTGVSYSDHYEEKGLFQQLMDRLRRIAPRGRSYAPVMVPALSSTGCPARPSSGCIESYARNATAMEQRASTRGLAETESPESGEAAGIELSYRATGVTSRAKPTLGDLNVCIIQVSARQRGGDRGSVGGKGYGSQDHLLLVAKISSYARQASRRASAWACRRKLPARSW